MSHAGYIALLVGLSAAITWALRALPFAALAPMRHSTTVQYLSLHMPLGVMIVLALSTLHGHAHDTPIELAWLTLAVGVTVALHLWRGHALTSILGGTTVYVVLSTVW